jgi:hypothetical protein
MEDAWERYRQNREPARSSILGSTSFRPLVTDDVVTEG